MDRSSEEKSKKNNLEQKKVRKVRGGHTLDVANLNWQAAIVGWVCAFFVGLFLSSLAGALVTGLGGATTQVSTSLGVAGGVAGLIVWFISFLIGGYLSGRLSHFNGLIHGLSVWFVGLIFIMLLLIMGAILGPGIAVVGGISLPTDVGNIAAILSIGVLILLVDQLAGALLGGWVSEKFPK